MSKALTCKIWTLKKLIYDGEVVSLTYPNIQFGPTTILADHIATIGLMKTGSLKYHTPEGERSLPVSKGIVHVEKNNIVVLLMP